MDDVRGELQAAEEEARQQKSGSTRILRITE
jgi:hypothetical protein